MGERNRCCCNCGHNIRIKDTKTGVVECRCDIDGHRIGYIETFEGWCRRWKTNMKWVEEPTEKTDEIDFDYEAEDGQ